MAAFVQIAGTQIALPDYARPDLAFTRSRSIGTVAAGQNVQITIGGGFIEIPLNVFAVFTTDNTATARTVEAVFEDSVGNSLSQTPANGQQAASVTRNYNFNVGLPTPYGPISVVFSTGLPTLPLLGGQIFALTSSPIPAGDQFSAVVLITMAVPTGPSRSTAAPQLVPTPLIA